MKSLSRWAHRHTRLAIGLIIVCEFIVAHNGFVLGAELLANVSAVGLFSGVGAVVVGVGWLRTRQRRYHGRMTYAAGRWLIAGAFAGNFLLALLLGGMLGSQVNAPDSEWAVYGGRRVIAIADTLPEVRSVRRTTNQTDYYVQKKKTDADRATGRRIGYVALFILSIVLFSFSAGLSCTFACAGNGFLAILMLIVGFGLLAGGVLFLTRATEPTILPMRDMSEARRKRFRSRFWLLFGITILGLFLLTAI